MTIESKNQVYQIEKTSLSSIVIVIFEKPGFSADKLGLSKTMTIESKNQVYQIEKPSLSSIVIVIFEKPGFSGDKLGFSSKNQVS